MTTLHALVGLQEKQKEWPHQQLRRLACPGCRGHLPDFSHLMQDGKTAIFWLDRWEMRDGAYHTASSPRRRPRRSEEFGRHFATEKTSIVIDGNSADGKGEVLLPATFICGNCQQRVRVETSDLL